MKLLGRDHQVAKVRGDMLIPRLSKIESKIKISGSESFTRWLVGPEGTDGCGSCCA